MSMDSGLYNRKGIEAETPSGFEKVVEGHAAILFPPAKLKGEVAKTTEETTTKKKKPRKTETEDAEKDGGDEQSIFYNPAQVVNRDLSICAIETFSEIRKTETRRKGGVGEDGISILEALSATGLRAIRYWKEIAGVRTIFANDLDSEAVDCIRRNCDYNGVPVANSQTAKGVVANCDDAIVLMQRLGLDPNLPYRLTAVDPESGEPTTQKTLLQSERVDVVDLDPYGSASPFIDPAMQCAKEGALMLVTCTDSAILCGNYPETCFGKYGSASLRVDSCHEMATRIVLGLLEQTANKHRRYIQPLLSLHIDFYVRVFIRVWTQPAEVKRSCNKMGMAFHCVRCPFHKVIPMADTRLTRKAQSKRTREAEEAGNDAAQEDQGASALPVVPECTFPRSANRTDPVSTHCSASRDIPTQCEACGNKVTMAGPMYCAPTHDSDFLAKLMETIKRKDGEGRLAATDRISGLVRTAMEELPDVPLFYDLPEVASALHMHCPPTPNVVGALTRLGYRCSQVHPRPSGLKTSAPPSILYGVLKYYNETVHHEEEKPTKVKEKKTATAADPAFGRIVVKYPSVACDVSYDIKYDWRGKKTGVSNFIPNAPFWGPKRRHQGVREEEEGAEE